ncbi:hypothetical protein FQN60_004011 [Etheostoma spectabile]|uniref:Uncharacterized protein n=1 Tax=Etheostoma spectabile TaxID=54343 RepID=A0A5J5CUD8_9PERO|nr:hypothetical protein FQN60_004011 [Etheostoma spectabile]
MADAQLTFFIVLFHRPRGPIRNSPPSSRTRSVFWSLMVARRSRKSSPATTKVWDWDSKPQERLLTALTLTRNAPLLEMSPFVAVSSLVWLPK